MTMNEKTKPTKKKPRWFYCPKCDGHALSLFSNFWKNHGGTHLRADVNYCYRCKIIIPRLATQTVFLVNKK